MYLGSWLIVIIPAAAGLDMEWYTAHQYLATSSWIDILVIMLKFHPLFYVHIYAFGVALACLYNIYQKSPPLIFKYGASCGYIGLGLVFTIPALDTPGSVLSTRLGILLPLHALVLFGLTVGKDPIARLFSWFPLQAIAAYSYAVYVFQFNCFYIWMGYVDFGFILFLLATAICTQRFTKAYFADTPQHFERNMKVLAALMVLVLFVWGVLPDSAISKVGFGRSLIRTPADT
jgi:peptidoglycan/LPS O-acetylase OafA/YrhL